MMNEIEYIPWGTLSANIDRTERLAALLTQLLSGKRDDSEAVLEQILNAIYAQGTIYEATPYVLPFLLMFAHQLAEQELLSLFALLAIMSAETYEDVNMRGKKVSDRTADTYHAICDGVPLYLSLLQKPQITLGGYMRGFVIYILGFCSASMIDIIHPLKEQLTEEHDEAIRFLLIRAIMAHNGFNEYELTALFTSTSSKIERCALALSLVEMLHDKVTLEVGNVIAELVQSGVEESLKKLIDLLPILHIFREIAHALELLGRSRNVPLLSQMIIHWSTERTSYDLMELIELALDIVGFPKGGRFESSGTSGNGGGWFRYRLSRAASAVIVPPTSLSTYQQQILASICDCEAFWTIETNMLQIYALPMERDGLRAYMQQIIA